MGSKDPNRLMHDYARYLKSWHRLTSSRNASLVLVDDPPTLPDRGYRCTLHDEPCYIKKKLAALTVKPLREVNKNIATSSGVYFFSYFDLFCDEAICGANVPGTKT